MSFPRNLDELTKAGYTYVEHRPCSGRHCEAVLEFWKTPRGKFMPFDVNAKGDVEPHWATCPDQAQFRK